MAVCKIRTGCRRLARAGTQPVPAESAPGRTGTAPGRAGIAPSRVDNPSVEQAECVNLPNQISDTLN